MAGVYMRDVCIAKGQPPVNAENGRYELHFNPDVDGKPKVKEDGSIDYWSIRTVEMVKEGQTIATYYPPTEAVNGMNVSGKPILAVRGKPLQPLRGKGFHCTEDGSTYIADLSGKIEMSNGKIRISAVYEIPGDVGIGTGNVEYHGDVVIHGGIKPEKTTVRTSGSLTVSGSVRRLCIFLDTFGGDVSPFPFRANASTALWAPTASWAYQRIVSNNHC